MVRVHIISFITFALTAYAAGPIPAGQNGLGNGQGKQFITGPCSSNADCASACCAQSNGGAPACAAKAVANENGQNRCGNFGKSIGDATNANGRQNSQKSNNSSGLGGAKADPAGAKNLGNGQGKQFITGQCLSDADCASACCAQQNGGAGVCSGVGAAFQAGKTGCGFVDPNSGN
ncbi:hypothetical protein NOR_02448 [Metarhizium rileyi]|uniref:Biotrophy-associated secreted protein 2 n=1 Tax=Metarhizium rileyi (strain RCEF 4871) TaxID=1649241 RepID=A0A167GLX7_METRR|nr:hypothetical protein NOR_02448 [Metarhizium rileyi RCEF 4871]